MGRSAAEVWCPHCEDWVNAYSINASVHGESNARQIVECGVPFHQRFRECIECGETFFTAELTYLELSALLDDRAKLKAVRKGLRTRR